MVELTGDVTPDGALTADGLGSASCCVAASSSLFSLSFWYCSLPLPVSSVRFLVWAFWRKVGFLVALAPSSSAHVLPFLFHDLGLELGIRVWVRVRVL